ncbi:MAG: hypothetical protein KAS32_25595 [Candidatus Peribacteraceae bacterium]|nr:hypothetical protein [Candidatus Peribacteraceae bacterium]
MIESICTECGFAMAHVSDSSMCASCESDPTEDTVPATKQWTQDECKALINEIANRLGIDMPVQFAVTKRQYGGTFSVKLYRLDNRTVRLKMFLAKYLWTGEYSQGRRKIPTYTCPDNRLLVVLHECAHMTLYATLDIETYYKLNHGALFQKAERALCKEFGFIPIYSKTPGYADYYMRIDDGRRFKNGVGYLD